MSKSIYFHSNEHKTNELNIEIQPKGNENKIKEKVKTNVTCRYAFNKIYDDFKEAFTNRYVLQWSIWWALATSGFLQVCRISKKNFAFQKTEAPHEFNK